MLYLNVFFILAFTVIFFLAGRGSKEWVGTLDKKEHKLFFLYPMAKLLLTKSGLEKKLILNSRVKEAVRALSMEDKPESRQKLYYYQKTAFVLLILMLFQLLSLLSCLQADSGQEVYSDQHLTRPKDGEADSRIEFKVVLKKDDADSNDPDHISQKISVPNKVREYTKEELQQVFQKAAALLETEFLGENRDTDNVNRDLNFISQVPGTSITVEWIPEDYDLISGSGEVHMEEAGGETANTLVTAILTYKDNRISHPIPVRIVPPELSAAEQLSRDLAEDITKASDQSIKQKRWKLPDQLGEYTLVWEEIRQDSGLGLFLVGILASFLLWFFSDRDLDKRLQNRKNQMMLDYPEIINKFNLLVNAGMTIKQAWLKIAEDYKKKLQLEHRAKRYAYDEMLFTVHELRLGIPESNAYEQFGKRTGLMPYLKFSTLITQNLKRGNRGLSELLSREALEAFEERKEHAKRMGEEAGTKLLIPMMLMLLIVLIIILIPAFLSFNL